MIDLGPAPVRATRMTYVGELGWELTGADRVGRAASTTRWWRRAPTSGCADAGYYAIESLRLEKGYRAFGRELTPDYTPVEAGLVFACELPDDDGLTSSAARRSSSDARAAGGPRRRLVSFVVDDPDAMLWGGELVLRDGDARRSGDQRRLGRDRGRLRRAGLPARRRPGHRRPGWPRVASRSTWRGSGAAYACR